MNELKQRPVWLCWRYEEKGGRKTKVPYSALTGRRTGTSQNHAAEWTDFTRAGAARGFDGVGFVLPELEGGHAVFVVDIDHCSLDDPATVAALDCFPGEYAEHSPSGEGVHVIGIVELAQLPAACFDTYYMKNPGNGMEIYIAGMTNRYMTYTGNVIMGGTLPILTTEVLAFLDKFMRRPAAPAKAQQPPPAAGHDLTDKQLLHKARAAGNGAKFSALFDRGDLSGYDGDDSSADMGLLNLLAFWTEKDPAQMERLFGLSALGQRGKWQGRADYRQRSISRAIADCREVYDPKKQPTAAGDMSLKPGDYSDVGQAEVLAREYGENLRYSEATDFISYGGVFWEECKPKAQGIAQELTRRQLDEARRAVDRARKKLEEIGEGDAVNHPKKQAVKDLSGAALAAFFEYCAAVDYRDYVVKAHEDKRITAALKQVRSMVLIDIADLDADPYLLNTPGATYDLRRGMGGARAHSAGDYITRCTAVSPSGDGADLWQKLLQDVFLGNADLIEYVQRVAGVCAVGKVYIEQLVISHGDGRNGKSTFWNPILRVFGSYAGSMSADALTANCRHNVRPELAELRGKRAVLARELQEGKRLDESILKKITSTDPIDAEKKYKSPFTFTPTHTPLMYTNFLPKIGSRDAGTKRRLCVVPFTAKFEGKGDVKNYGDYLFEHTGGAILQWIIEGAKKVIDADFHIEPPDCVRQATQDYIDAFDWLSKFLEARCFIGDGIKEQSGALYNAYRAHCDDINESYKRGAQDFNAALIGAGFERVQPGGSKKPAFFQGLRLLTDAERDFDDAGDAGSDISPCCADYPPW